MSLNAIRFVIDITDSPRAFALLCRQDKDKLHSFTITDEEIDKVMYLKTLCKQMAENACRTDTVGFGGLVKRKKKCLIIRFFLFLG